MAQAKRDKTPITKKRPKLVSFEVVAAMAYIPSRRFPDIRTNSPSAARSVRIPVRVWRFRWQLDQVKHWRKAGH